MTQRAIKVPRVLQITVMVLVLVCTVQVGWWIYDQHRYAVEKVAELQRAYQQQAAAARALLIAGVPVARVQRLLPGVELTPDGARPSPTAEHRLLSEEHLRIEQYAWEGAFFLLALGACIVVIALALRAEARSSPRRPEQPMSSGPLRRRLPADLGISASCRRRLA